MLDMTEAHAVQKSHHLQQVARQHRGEEPPAHGPQDHLVWNCPGHCMRESKFNIRYFFDSNINVSGS